MEYQNILVEVQEGIGILTLNRPEVRNALSYELWDDVRLGIRELYTHPDVRVIILTGAGGKSFASGGDINGLHNRKWYECMNGEVTNLLHEIANLNTPTIAAVEGYALGGGCELSMACDIRIASRKSKFGQPETGLGIIPAAGGTQRLQRLVGIGKAKELIFTGDIINAEEAERIGLVQKVVDDGEAMNAALEMARKIQMKSPSATRIAKTAMNLGANMDLYSGVIMEKYFASLSYAAEDKREGTLAFIEKRPPNFTGK